jgi:hypothetical protein
MTSAPNQSEGPAPAVLYGPILGFHNLAGAAADADLTMDRDALAPIFRGPVVEAAKRPRCNVLFLYCAFDADGRVTGANQHFPDIVKACGARFAVVVPSGVAPSPTSAITDSDWGADLIFVLDRKGARFPAFFQSLFRSMFEGKTFVDAWVDLAPQGPVPETMQAPEMVAIPKIPNLAFAPDWFPNKLVPPAAEIEGLADDILSELSAPRPAGLRALWSNAVGPPDGREVEDEPTLLTILGALMGYSVIRSIQLGKYVPAVVSNENKQLLLELKTKDGRIYWFGDLINGLLFEHGLDRVCAWQVLEAKIRSKGLPVPDLIPIVRQTSKSISEPNFGSPRAVVGTTPAVGPLQALRSHWSKIEAILTRHRRPPAGWPVDIACVIARKLDGLKSVAPNHAAQIAMEAAIPMSKVKDYH